MSKRRTKKTVPKISHPLDVALGKRIRAIREAAHVSQVWVARECGITPAQLQKYESGENRVAFSRLVELAQALNVKVIVLIGPLLG